MEDFEKREIARRHNAQVRSVERCLEYGVDELDVSDLLGLRRSARVTDENLGQTYTPGIKIMAGMYKATEGDLESMQAVVDEFQATAKDSVDKATQHGDYVESWKDVQEAYTVAFSNIIATQFDEWFEKTAHKYALGNDHGDTESEKRMLYSSLGMHVTVETESTQTRIKQKIKQRAFEEGFPPDFDLLPVSELLETDHKVLQRAVESYGLSGAALRTYAALYPVFTETVATIDAHRKNNRPTHYWGSHLSFLADSAWQNQGHSSIRGQLAFISLMESRAGDSEPSLTAEFLASQMKDQAVKYWTTTPNDQIGQEYVDARYEMHGKGFAYVFNDKPTRILLDAYGFEHVRNQICAFAMPYSHPTGYRNIVDLFGMTRGILDSYCPTEEPTTDESNLDAADLLLKRIFENAKTATLAKSWQRAISRRQREAHQWSQYSTALATAGQKPDPTQII